jgi:hypothetical protein
MCFALSEALEDKKQQVMVFALVTLVPGLGLENLFRKKDKIKHRPSVNDFCMIPIILHVLVLPSSSGKLVELSFSNQLHESYWGSHSQLSSQLLRFELKLGIHSFICTFIYSAKSCTTNIS